jgi:hypothetical protein
MRTHMHELEELFNKERSLVDFEELEAKKPRRKRKKRSERANVSEGNRASSDGRGDADAEEDPEKEADRPKELIEEEGNQEQH